MNTQTKTPFGVLPSGDSFLTIGQSPLGENNTYSRHIQAII